jgi:hypothetical protein
VPSCGGHYVDEPHSFCAGACLQAEGPAVQQPMPEQQLEAAVGCEQPCENAAALESVLRQLAQAAGAAVRASYCCCCGQCCGCLELLTAFVAWLLQERPTQAKQLCRLGRCHRAANGETIRLRLAQGSSGNKAKAFTLHRLRVTWSLPSRAIAAMLVLLFEAAAGGMAMRVATHHLPSV